MGAWGRWFAVTLLGALLVSLPLIAAAGAPGSLEAVRQRGKLLCGVSKGAPGFAAIDEAGRWHGIEVDFCAALAAAVLGKHGAVTFVPLTGADRYSALESGAVDILAQYTTWTIGRDTQRGLRFVGPLYYEGTALLVRSKQGVGSALELSGATFCVQAGSPAEQNVETYFSARNMRHELIALKTWSEIVSAFIGKRCTVLAADATTLAARLASLGESESLMVLPETIALEPLGPAVRKGDDKWFDIVRWTLMALVRAEELGIARANVDAMRRSKSRAVHQFLGIDSPSIRALGLGPDWTFNIVKQVGNYGESFERHLGAGSPFKMARGLNNLWSKGGLLAAPPFR